MIFVVWEIVAPIFVLKSELLPDAILFNAPRSQVWLILALVGFILFTLYGASKDKGELLAREAILEAKLAHGSPESPIEPKATVFIEPFDPEGHPSAAGWMGHGELRNHEGRVLPLRLSLSATNAVLLEQVELEIAGKRLTSGWESDWLSVGVTTDATVEFALTTGISKGNHDVRVLGYAEGNWFASKRFTVGVP